MNNGIYTDFSSFAGLRAQARNGDEEATRRVARQFEALFVQMMVKSMRDATPESELFGQSLRTYQDLYDRQLTLELTAQRGIGIADMLERQLAQPGTGGGAELYLSRYAGSAAAESTPPAASVPGPVGSASAGDKAARFEGPEQFVQALLPHARDAGARLGVDPKVLLAQAALETGWGKHVIHDGEGRSSNNFFGIKADSRWAGERVRVPTLESVDGVLERMRADFRAYDSPATGFQDYVDFLSSNRRYAGALAAVGDPAAYLRGLQSAGYATDPKYADKILRILGRDDLNLASADPYAMMREVF